MDEFQDILKITHKIIGCAMKVHSTLGNGFQEVIYQRSLAIEMSSQGLTYSREHEMPIYYQSELVGSRRVDFLVESGISVELKAVANLEDIHFAQAINYLEAYNLRTGLLINFGSKSLQFHRLTNKKFKPSNYSSSHG
ncbi:MAG: GxxExxY protein [Bacteroidota bacterium]|nr:GxxExxY protein [Bacteroidota bacterium]MDP4229788.1 GxxExxY protein [Bacteroidota bacterium]MDP4236673.1 GxxExxY protein [Bacteroidota bacterium]